MGEMSCINFNIVDSNVDFVFKQKLFQESKEKSDLNMQRALGKDGDDDDDNGEGSDDDGDGGVDVDNDTLPIDESPSPVKESSAVKNVKKRPSENGADDDLLKKKVKQFFYCWITLNSFSLYLCYLIPIYRDNIAL